MKWVREDMVFSFQILVHTGFLFLSFKILYANFTDKTLFLLAPHMNASFDFWRKWEFEGYALLQTGKKYYW